MLVVFEEVGGDPTKLSFATREVGSLCSRVSESHPMPVDMWTSDVSGQKPEGATLSLECPLPNQVISTIKFASFGTPQGTCGSFSHGKCKSTNALSVVKKVSSLFFVLSNRITWFSTLTRNDHRLALDRETALLESRAPRLATRVQELPRV